MISKSNLLIVKFPLYAIYKSCASSRFPPLKQHQFKSQSQLSITKYIPVNKWGVTSEGAPAHARNPNGCRDNSEVTVTPLDKLSLFISQL